MVKVLVCGNINGEWSNLIQRLNLLQSSQQGPFDCLFLCGITFITVDEIVQSFPQLDLPIITYLYDSYELYKESTAELPKNLFYLQSFVTDTINSSNIAVCELPNKLTIGYINIKGSESIFLDDIENICNDINYKGCDILLSNNWPNNIMNNISSDELDNIKLLLPNYDSLGSSEVSSLCNIIQSRYLFTSNYSFFYQRIPYTNKIENICTRFINLNEINQSKDKTKKYLHALSINPLLTLSVNDLLADIPTGITKNPFENENENESGNENENENEKKRRKVDSESDRDVNNQIKLTLIPPNDTCKTLFLGKINKYKYINLKDLFPNATSIIQPNGKDYAFIEFSSYESANEIMNQRYNLNNNKYTNLLIGWAQGKPAEKTNNNSHANDCWFCLASPTVKFHLIVSVSDHAYLALPRGGMVDNHILIVPIECVPSRIHLSEETRNDFKRYENSLLDYYKSINQSVIIYERAIRTKGKDHMQQHMIPITNDKNGNYIKIFHNVIQKYNLTFHEIIETDIRDIEDIVIDMEGGPYQEYFYISIPTNNNINKRFVYVHKSIETNNQIDKTKDKYMNKNKVTGFNRYGLTDTTIDNKQKDNSQFPMFIGSEIIAFIINKPERAFWKNCLLDEENEKILAENFRNQFEKFDFSLK